MERREEEEEEVHETHVALRGQKAPLPGTSLGSRWSADFCFACTGGLTCQYRSTSLHFLQCEGATACPGRKTKTGRCAVVHLRTSQFFLAPLVAAFGIQGNRTFWETTSSHLFSVCVARCVQELVYLGDDFTICFRIRRIASSTLVACNASVHGGGLD